MFVDREAELAFWNGILERERRTAAQFVFLPQWSVEERVAAESVKLKE
jgi:hypothetical protein